MAQRTNTESPSTELAVLDSVSTSAVVSTLDSLNIQHGKARGVDFFSTLEGDDRATKLKTLAAMTDSTPVVDQAGNVIKVADVLVHSIEMTDETTGELQTVARIILITEDGAAYHAISGGLLKSLQNIFMVMGPKDTWGGPIPLIVEKLKGGKGFYYTAKVDLSAL